MRWAVVPLCVALGACAQFPNGILGTTKPLPAEVRYVCLPLKTYTRAEQTELASEMKVNPPKQMAAMMGDYLALRNANRATCNE